MSRSHRTAPRPARRRRARAARPHRITGRVAPPDGAEQLGQQAVGGVLDAEAALRAEQRVDQRDPAGDEVDVVDASETLVRARRRRSTTDRRRCARRRRRGTPGSRDAVDQARLEALGRVLLVRAEVVRAARGRRRPRRCPSAPPLKLAEQRSLRKSSKHGPPATSERPAVPAANASSWSPSSAEPLNRVPCGRPRPAPRTSGGSRTTATSVRAPRRSARAPPRRRWRRVGRGSRSRPRHPLARPAAPPTSAG